MGRKLKLSPEGDEWFETEEVPDLIINVEGNFDTIQNGLRNQGVLGTVWNAWQTQWSGVVGELHTPTSMLMMKVTRS